MKLALYRHLWGIDELWETAFPKIKEHGYDGIETHLALTAEEQKRLRNLLKQHAFRFIATIFYGRRNSERAHRLV